MTGRVLTAACVALTGCAPAPRWLAVGTSDAVVFLDGRLHQVARAPLPIEPQQLAFAPDGASLFIGAAQGPGLSLLARLPREGGALGGTSVEGDVRRLAFTRDGRTLLLATSRGPTGLMVASTATLAVTRIAIACDANDLVATASGERAYLICADGKVVEVDPALQLVVQVADLGGREPRCEPAAAALSANGTVLFVACAASGALLYLDRVTLAPFDSLTIPSGARHLAVSGRHALLTIPGVEGQLVIVDVRARSVQQVVSLPGALNVAVTAAGRRALVTAPPRIIEVDVDTGQVLQDTTHAGITGSLALWPGPWEPRIRWDYCCPGAISATVSGGPASKS